MPLDFGFAFESLKQNAVYYFGTTLKSSIWTAILITAIIAVVLMLLYPTRPRTPFYKILRPLLYMFIFTLIVMFMHDSVLLDEIKLRTEELESKEVAGGLQTFNQKNRSANIYEVLYPGDSEGGDEDIEPRPHKQIGPLASVESEENNNKEETEDEQKESSVKGEIIDTKI